MLNETSYIIFSTLLIPTVAMLNYKTDVIYTLILKIISLTANLLSWSIVEIICTNFFIFFTGGLPDKKFEVDKRAMNLGDFNDMMRKDRSGFRPPNSKDMGTTDSGPYFEKVREMSLDKFISTSMFKVPVFTLLLQRW